MSIVDPTKIEALQKAISARREEILADWTSEKCPEEHKEGWLAWEYARRTLMERGLDETSALMLQRVWMDKVRNGFFGTYGAIVTMLESYVVVLTD